VHNFQLGSQDGNGAAERSIFFVPPTQKVSNAGSFRPFPVVSKSTCTPPSEFTSGPFVDILNCGRNT
jgi:hypothetical protein